MRHDSQIGVSSGTDASALARLSRAALEDGKAYLRGFVEARLGELLAWPEPRRLAPDQPLLALGIDSLRAVDFKIVLEAQLACSLRSSLLFDHPTLEALTHYLAVEVFHLVPAGEPRAHGGGAVGGHAGAAPAIEALDQMPEDQLLAVLRASSARLDALERARSEPIAVVGIGCRFPAGVTDAEALWRLQRDGIDAITEVPPGRWDLAAFYDPDPAAPGKMTARYGGFLGDLAQFDAAFFGISAREATQIDPQQRLLLECAWEALEHAGQAPRQLSGAPVGVFVGCRSSEYAWSRHGLSTEHVGPYFNVGDSISMTAGRVSYLLGLTGPSLALDTACSSSLVAVHLACEAIRRGECRAALAGGVHVMIMAVTSVGLSKAGMLARDGRCKTFSAAADGYVRAEGCGVIYLKRLSDARRDGDRVLAVVRGSAVNQDGASAGLTVPSGAAQEAVIRRALQVAGVAPGEVSYIEAHGTGTSLGDPIEVNALGAVFAPHHTRDRPLRLGSVKTNIGHAETAAGIAGLIKCVMALQHEQLPAHLHFDEPNPFVAWHELPFEVPLEATPWPRGDRPRIAGISSFGFSGTNCHVVLAEAPAEDGAARRAAVGDRSVHLLAISGKTAAAVQEVAARYRDHLRGDPAGVGDLADLCYSANTGRSQFHHRAAVVCRDRGALIDQLDQLAGGETPAGAFTGTAGATPPRVAFLFSGQGAQYPGMARGLYETQPVFRRAIDRCDAILRALPGAPGSVPLTSILWGEHQGLIHETRYTQPALFAVEHALVALWGSWGIAPQVVIGHSVGEYVAAATAGVFSLEQGLALIAARGHLMHELTAPGEMAVVFASPDEVVAHVAPCADRVAIAAIDGPASVVVSGEPRAVRAIVDGFAARGTRTRMLDVRRAFHSPLMAPMLDRFAAVAAGIRFQRPVVPMISNLHGGLAGDEVTTADYWVRHVAAPVRFADGVAALGGEAPDAFLEIGPTPALLPMARPLLPRARDALWLASLAHGKADDPQMLGALGALHVRGAGVDWAGFDRDRGRRKVALPFTPFQRQRCWADDPPAGEGAARAGTPIHPCLGHRLASALLADGALQFEVALGRRATAFLQDHRVREAVVVPAAVFVEIALAAGHVAVPGAALALHELAVQVPLVIPERGEARVQIIVAPPGEQGRRVEIHAMAAGAGEARWVRHAAGVLWPVPAGATVAGEPLAALRARIVEGAGREVDVAALYAGYRALGLDHGPAFQSIEQAWCADGEALSVLRVPAPVAGGAAAFHLHPAVLDGAFQTVRAAIPDHEAQELYLPVDIERVQRLGAPGARVWCHARVRPVDPATRHSRSFDLVLFSADERGDDRAVAEIRGFRTARAGRGVLRPGTDAVEQLLYAVAWQPRAGGTPVAAPAGGVLIVADRGGVGAALAARLAAQGEQVVTVPAGELDGASPEGRCRAIVHLAALDEATAALDGDTGGGALGDAVARCCGSALHLVQAIAEAHAPQPPRLWLVTRGAQPVAGSPMSLAQTPLWGLGATLALEHPELACVRLDLDPAGGAGDTNHAGDADALAAELAAADDEAQLAYRGGVRHVARLARRAARAIAPVAGQPFQLRASAYGALENLSVQPLVRRAPGRDEVEIQVVASSLNFKDVLHTLGLLQAFSERAGIARSVDQPLGFECAGTVVAVGEGVAGRAVGDAVIATGQGCLASHVTTAAALVATRPAALSFAEAAALPTVFSTAIYALRRLAKLQRGERVLIHAAAGGVGQAAIQIARGLGAEVFATASPGKWAHLTAQGVAHVMSSRTLEFAAQVRERTHGEGVHVVLNSLAGEVIPRSLDVLAPGGRYVEIGKLGVWGAAQVASVRPDVAYHVFDLADGGPALSASLLAETVAGFADGSLRPLATTVFPAGDAVGAMRYLAQAKNIGKVVVAMPADGDALPIRADRTYWITGGFGALGLAVAAWLVEHGATDLVLSGRTGPSDDARAAVARLAQAGARVRALALDVTVRAQVAAALDDLAATLPPLGGVVHAAGVIDDGVMARLAWPRFAEVMAPKVLGAWHLHQLTRDLALDFFVCFSSVASVLGSPGQANYAAGNAFLDGLAHHRRALGLPALSINWGPWSGGGMASGVARRNRVRFAELGLTSLSPAQGVDVLGHLLRQDHPQVLVLPIQWAAYLTQYQPHQRPRLLDAFGASGASGEGAAGRTAATIRQQLAQAAPAARTPLLEGFLRQQLARVLGLASPDVIERDQPLFDLGVDSLMATELRSRLEGQLSVGLRATLIFNYPTLQALAHYLITDALRLPIDEAAPVAVSVEVGELVALPAEVPGELAGLSDDEIERRLERSMDRLLGPPGASDASDRSDGSDAITGADGTR
jgi:acyl transferase domain-containing protein/NADPH:quinone reductase-like Zn-dependent oxidoreductase/acyl carrier protein